MAFLMFEIARRFRAYDYRSMVKRLLGPFWFLFDIIYLLLAVLMISIVIAATGSILHSTLGLNYWIGVAIIAIIAGLLNFYGANIIERFKTIGTIALFSAYILFAILVISSTSGEIKEVLHQVTQALLLTFQWDLYFGQVLFMLVTTLLFIQQHYLHSVGKKR